MTIGSFYAENYGAVANGVTDDAGAIQAAINAATAAGRGEVILPGGVCRTAAGLVMQSNAVSIIGDGPDISTIRADLAVPVALSAGGSGSTFYSCNNFSGFTIDRAPGVVGMSAIGLNLHNFAYFTADNIFVRNQGIAFAFGADVSQSLGFRADNCYSANIKNVDIVIGNCSTVEFYKSEFGRNGGETYDRQGFAQISGLSDSIVFDHVEFIPRGPGLSTPYLILFTAYDASSGGFIRLDSVNTEGVSGCFISDANTPAIHDLQVRGGRYVASTVFALNAATSLRSSKITDASLAGAFVLTKPNDVKLNGNTFINGMNLYGGGSGIATANGNSFSGGPVSLNGAWSRLTMVGNTFHSGVALSDTSTGVKSVSLNTGG